MAIFTLDIETNIEIDASPDQVWQVLTDFDAYDDWNPMLRKVRTRLEPGAKVNFEVLREDARTLKLAAKITEHNAGRSLAWRGGSRAFVSGEHYFRIEKLDDHRTGFHHGEHFSGIFLPLMRPVLNNAASLYKAMNQAIKRVVERPADTGSGAITTAGKLNACNSTQHN